ncbi:MAG: UbiA family prenyltransferase [Candidatus Dojkabacteria bacterium]
MINSIKKEINIFWRFIRSDIWATIIPGLIMTSIALIHFHIDLKVSIIILFQSLIYFTLYEYSFVLTNQLGSIEEDSINKPFRPLPQKLVTRNQTLQRSLLVSLIFLIVGFLLGILPWAILWVSVSLFHNIWGHRHWLTKNVISMSLGILSIIGAAWELVMPLEPSVLKWGIVISTILGFCAVMQDFRDVSGDRLSKRKTLPIDLGDYKARIVSFFISVTSFIVFYIFIIYPSRDNDLTRVFSLVIFFLFLFIPTRLLIYRDPKSDHITYTILLYLFNLLLLSGLVYL